MPTPGRHTSRITAKKSFTSLGNHWYTKGSFIYYVHKIFQKTNISYPLIRTRTSAYQGVRNVSFSENFANVLNEWSQQEILGQIKRNLRKSILSANIIFRTKKSYM